MNCKNYIINHNKLKKTMISRWRKAYKEWTEIFYRYGFIKTYILKLLFFFLFWEGMLLVQTEARIEKEHKYYFVFENKRVH